VPDAPSPWEAVARALTAALRTVPGALVLRGGALPEAVPPAGVANLVETDPVELAELVGGEREWLWEVAVELAVAAADDADRAAALDALARACAAAVRSDAALAALVDGVRVHALRDRQDLPQPGAAAIRSATLPVELLFATGPDPMEP
jgi:hypothetical protein